LPVLYQPAAPHASIQSSRFAPNEFVNTPAWIVKGEQ